MQEAIHRMGQVVGAVAKSLQTNIERASHRDEQRSNQLVDNATAASDKVATITRALIQHTGEAVSKMRDAVESMRSGTADTVTKMNLGAADMLKAAGDMARAGSATSTVLERAQQVANQLTTASGALSNSTVTLNKVSEDYKVTRDTLALMIEQLKAIVEHAKREASLADNMLQRIEAATKGLGEVQTQAGEYLNGISEVLANAHQEFGVQIISTLHNVNGEFHKHVERGTKALGGAIDELAEVLDRVGDL